MCISTIDELQTDQCLDLHVLTYTMANSTRGKRMYGKH
ncbi:Ethanolamine permease [Giardia duodenalis]|uniref:Ethanolamine permease n=1 Tax=Giardia intestinalis TaxID=5741 RepID=V6U6I4_GIAIN|nr:Ethanolamine permease [Giardia intestinalis]